jgi:hypothetical protein
MKKDVVSEPLTGHVCLQSTCSSSDLINYSVGTERKPYSSLEDPVRTSSDKATVLIPQVPGQGASPLGIEGSPSLAGLGAAAPSSPFAWYPDIQPNNNIAPRLVTPGYGTDHPACGEVRFKVLCPDDPGHYAKLNHYNCHRPACPTCYPSWAARAADRAADTVDGYKSATGTPYNARHVTISPDPYSFPFPDASPEALRYLAEEGRRVCVLLGVSAAAAILHPYRIRKEYKHIVSQLADQAGVNRYVWALQQENWADLVYFSPHIHLLAYGPLMDADKFEEKTGWVYRNHDDGADSGRSGFELKRTIYYLLTHAWVRDNNKAVRYWFGMSSRRLECRVLPAELEPVLCPVCKTQAVKIPADVVTEPGGLGKPVYQDLHNAPGAYRKIIIRIYLVRVPRARNRKRISARSLALWGPAGPPQVEITVR